MNGGVVWLTRGLAGFIGLFTWLILRKPRGWAVFVWLWQCGWDLVKHLIVTAAVIYVSYFLMMKLWYAHPMAFIIVQVNVDRGFMYMAQLFWDGAYFVLELFSMAAISAIINGFNVTVPEEGL